MKKTLTSLTALMLLAGCGNETTTPQSPDNAEVQTATTQVDAEISAEESARLNAFFATKFDEALSRSPVAQTFRGIKTDYDKWDDASEENALRELQIQRETVAEMHREFDPANLDAQAALSFRMASYELEQAERDFKYRSNVLVFNQMRGQHSGIPAFLINQHRISNVSDAEAYIARLNGIPAYLGAFQARAITAADNGVLAPRFFYDYVIDSA